MHTTRKDLLARTSILVALCLLAACGGSGGGGAPGAGTPGSVTGAVAFDPNGIKRARAGGFDDREPNDHLFEVQDLGTLAGRRVVRGTLEAVTDRVDFFRFDVGNDGHVKVALRSTSRTTLLAYVARGGRGRPAPISRQAAGARLDLPVVAGDHLILGVTATGSATFGLTMQFDAGAAMALPAALTEDAHAAAQAALLPRHVEVRPGELVLRFAGEEAAGLHSAGLLGLESVRSGGGIHRMRATQPAATTDDPAGYAALANVAFEVRRRVPQAVAVEPNYVYRTTLEPNDTLYQSGQGDWHHKICNMPKAWDVTTGNGVVVAVLDTGVLSAHEDLKANTLATDGYDFVDDDADANDPLRSGASYHGSHVAGIIAAATNNSTGVAGACWNARILPLRVLGVDGSGSVFSISQAILYAAGLPNQSGRVPQNKARIINMSLGGPAVSTVIRDACAAAHNAGAILVAAAGNEFQQGNPTSYPAAYPNVIGVGSVGPTKSRAFYSNTGSYVDIAAPGGDQSNAQSDGVLSTVAVEQNGQFFSGYAFMQGTSMATPFASGVIALMLAKKPAMTAAEVLAVLGRTAEDLGAPGRDDEFGFGLIDAAAALKDGNNGGSNGTIKVSTQAVVFGAADAEQRVGIVATNGSALPLTLTQDAGAPWLTARLTATATPADLLLTVDRTGLAPGAHRATVRVASGATSLAIDITLQIQAGSPVPKTAVVQVLGPNGQLVSSATTGAAGAFVLQGLAAGDYTLRIGVDTNDNGRFTDPGDWRSAERTFVIFPGENLRLPTITVGRVMR